MPIDEIKYDYEFSMWIDGKNPGSWGKKAKELLRLNVKIVIFVEKRVPNK